MSHDTNTAWHQLTYEEVFRRLNSGQEGLSSGVAKARLAEYGYNELVVKKRTALVRFLMQFHNPLLYVLMVAALLTFFLREFLDMWVIIAVILATALIGFIQEGKAEASIESLKKMLMPNCTVMRDGQKKTVLTRELVPGDVVVLETGDRVPADLRLFQQRDFQVDEAMLTGESLPVAKELDAVEGAHLTPAEQTCMTFSGTFVTRGRGEGVVVATGKHTEVGKIAGMLEGAKRVTPPILKKIAEFTKLVIIVTLGFGALNFGLGFALGYDAVYMILATIGMIVAIIPEGLPAAIITAFAIGGIQMAKRNALIRRLPAVETLGCTTAICSDKTGTLTKNEMTVTKLYVGGRFYSVTGVGYEPVGEIRRDDTGEAATEDQADLRTNLMAGLCCSSAALVHEDDAWVIKGDPTEGAMLVSAAKAGLTERGTILEEIPFDSAARYMATLHPGPERNVIYVKGSPERVLEMCAAEMVDDGTPELSEPRRREILGHVESMAGNALRVMGLACKYVDRTTEDLKHDDLSGMIFLGLQGMIDPPRAEVIDAIKACKTAGIRPVMITGDHVMTAQAIARQIGTSNDQDEALTGSELSALSDDEFADRVNRVSVYARVAPEHKYKITEQLQAQGHVVAMTGDGVNDAPALKKADIGVAMGITGTEVSKEAADMVLTDDNFASIVAAVEEGRHVFNNILKVILYLLPTNGGQGLVIIGAVLLSPLIYAFAQRLPMEPVQILWVNLIIAIACAIPLVWEPKEKALLQRPPRDPRERLFNPLFIRRVGLVSLVSAAAVFVMYLAYVHFQGTSDQALAEAQTVAFTTLIMLQVFYLFTARSVRGSVFTLNPFANRWVVIGAAATVGLQLLIVYADTLFGVSPLRTMPFPAGWWIPLLLVSLSGLIAVEIEKLVVRRPNQS